MGVGLKEKLFAWIDSLALMPHPGWWLFLLAFAESSFFPIPPDVLLIPLALGNPRRALRFAAICTVGSVLGAMVGYAIGVGLYEAVGAPIMELYGYTEEYEGIGEAYRRNLVIALGTAGFTPIPFKVFTIAAGGFQVPFLPFVAVTFHFQHTHQGRAVRRDVEFPVAFEGGICGGGMYSEKQKAGKIEGRPQRSRNKRGSVRVGHGGHGGRSDRGGRGGRGSAHFGRGGPRGSRG